MQPASTIQIVDVDHGAKKHGALSPRHVPWTTCSS